MLDDIENSFTRRDKVLTSTLAVRHSNKLDHSSSRYESIISSNNDNRLFPGIPLYCEGEHKPLLRGVFHLIATLLLPYGYYNLYVETNGSVYCQTIGGVYIISNIWCYGFSSLYHVGTWSPKIEILLQKLDHCGIALLGAGTFMPAAFLLFPVVPYGILLAFISLLTCSYACYHILHSRPSVFRLILVAASIIPFLPLCYIYMNSIELACTFYCLLFRGLGLIIFICGKPNPLPSIFGYHEIFHIFDVVANTCVYIGNWSIIRRACNPFIEHQTVLDDILKLFYFIFGYNDPSS